MTRPRVSSSAAKASTPASSQATGSKKKVTIATPPPSGTVAPHRKQSSKSKVPVNNDTTSDDGSEDEQRVPRKPAASEKRGPPKPVPKFAKKGQPPADVTDDEGDVEDLLSHRGGKGSRAGVSSLGSPFKSQKKTPLPEPSDEERQLEEEPGDHPMSVDSRHGDDDEDAQMGEPSSEDKPGPSQRRPRPPSSDDKDDSEDDDDDGGVDDEEEEEEPAPIKGKGKAREVSVPSLQTRGQRERSQINAPIPESPVVSRRQKRKRNGSEASPSTSQLGSSSPVVQTTKKAKTEKAKVEKPKRAPPKVTAKKTKA